MNIKRLILIGIKYMLRSILHNLITRLPSLEWNKVSILYVEISLFPLSSYSKQHFLELSVGISLLLHADETLVQLLALQADGVVFLVRLSSSAVHTRDVAGYWGTDFFCFTAVGHIV
jgi:hypothetical protein